MVALTLLLPLCSASLHRTVLGSLEVADVLSALSGEARTAPGRALCSKLPLAPDSAASRETYRAVGAALELDRKAWPPLNHDLDVGHTLFELSTHQSVPLASLAETADALDALTKLSSWADSGTGTLAEMASRAAPPARLAQRFAGAFERDIHAGEVRLSSAAFPILKDRRATVASAEAALSSAVQRLVASGELEGALSEKDAAPQRRDGGRYVVPVRPGDKRSVGVEITTSRSGRTCFVEPHALVPVSASCRAAHAALDAAEARLANALCKLVLLHSPALCASLDAAAELDALLARASLGKAWEGRVPTVGDEGIMCVREARHPLLELQAVRAGAGGAGGAAIKGNSLSLGAANAGDEAGETLPPQGLLLTGPNGGGKSVVLKTAALFAVLVRLGLPLPCAAASASRPEPPRVDFFAHITTDLADAQSLSEGASSFAAQLRACKRALGVAESARANGEHALVVLDEPGASTDPLQGAAIARAVIEELLDHGALVLAATHSDALKVYGLAESRLMTGAMALAADGSPLYTMVPGAVGSSHALDAAKREGLPESVLSRAASLLPENAAVSGDDGMKQLQVETEKLITALQTRMAEADAAAEAAAGAMDEADAARNEALAAAARAAHSLKVSERFLDDRSKSIDGLIGRMRRSGSDDLQLLGETLKALRLTQRDAAEARIRALAALGLTPLNDALPLRTGTRVAYVADGMIAKAMDGVSVPLDAVVDDDAAPRDSTVKVSIDGMPPAYVPRDDLAVWAGGAADDFGDAGAWAWMGSNAEMAGASSGMSSGKKRRR